MSAQATTAVWSTKLKELAEAHRIKYGPTLRLVALAIADRAGPDGEPFFHLAAKTIADYCEISVRAARSARASLETMGVIERVSEDGIGRPCFRIPLQGSVTLKGGATVAGGGVQRLHPIPEEDTRTKEEEGANLVPDGYVPGVKRGSRCPFFPADVVAQWPELPKLWHDRMIDNRLSSKVSPTAEQKQIEELSKLCRVRGLEHGKSALHESTVATWQSVVYSRHWTRQLQTAPSTARPDSPLAAEARRQRNAGGP